MLKPVKRLGTLVLLAVIAATLGATRTQAATTAVLSSPTVAAKGSDLDALFNAVALAATSVSVSASLGNLSFLEATNAVKQVDVVLLAATNTPGLSIGARNDVLIRVQSFRPFAPSTSPIPEARTMLLYALGIFAIGWAVLRSRRPRPASSRAA